MVVRPALLCIALLMTALLAGCADNGATGSAPSTVPTGSAPSGQNAGNASTHGQYVRDESAVTVTHNGNQYQATKTVTFTNDFGGASQASVGLTTATGGVNFAAWAQGGYKVVATLNGNGNTEQQARDELAKLDVTHSDSLAGSKLSLDTRVVFPDNCNCGGGLAASLPAQPSYALTGSTDTGGSSESGLGGSSLTLSTDTGGVSAIGSFSVANLKADTGGVHFDGTFNDLTATTGTGGVTGSAKSTASGSYRLTSDTGGVSVTVMQGGGRAFDATADTQTGSASVSLTGTQPVGEQSGTHKHVQSDGYDSAAIKIMITASTSTGGASVNGS